MRSFLEASQPGRIRKAVADGVDHCGQLVESSREQKPTLGRLVQLDHLTLRQLVGRVATSEASKKMGHMFTRHPLNQLQKVLRYVFR